MKSENSIKRIIWISFPVFIGIGIMAALLTCFLALNFFVGLADFSKISYQDSRQIVTSKSFETIWETPIFSMPSSSDNGEYFNGKVFLLVKDNQIIMPQSNTIGSFPTGMILSSFDTETGQTIWQRPYSAKLDHVGRNSNNIYLLGSNRGAEKDLESCEPILPVCYSIKILALDSLTGEELWVANYPNTLHIDRFTIDDDVINIEGSSGYSLYKPEFSIDAKTGEKLTEFQGVDYSDDDPNKDIIESLGFNGVVSNYADNGDYIFFLTKINNSLWAIDKETMEISGQVQFDGAPFDLLFEQRSRGFAVESNGNKIAVYLGDSGQLLVLNFAPPE